MMQIMYEFFQTNGYVLELSLAIFLFTGRLERRPKYPLRVAICLAGLLGISFLCGLIPTTNVFMDSLYTILFFVLEVPCVYLCHPIQGQQAVFYITAACASQHIAYKMAELTCRTMALFMVLSPGWAGLLYAVLFVVYLMPCGLFFSHRLRYSARVASLTHSTVLPLLIGMQLSTNLFKNVFELYAPVLGFMGNTTVDLFDILCCLFLLFLQCEVTSTLSSRRDNDILTQLLYQQKQQMEFSREMVEIINIKCHDIKNQIALLGARVPPDEIEEIHRAISIYDAATQTGNEALDLLIVEKTLLCEKKHICFDYNADGAALNGLKPSDVYSLFGNAIDNAIEAAAQVTDSERRSIRLYVAREKGMLCACVENFYEGKITFQEGLPQTGKADKTCHGFGVKSIRMIVERYGGVMSIRARDGVFTLSILLPLTE